MQLQHFPSASIAIQHAVLLQCTALEFLFVMESSIYFRISTNAQSENHKYLVFAVDQSVRVCGSFIRSFLDEQRAVLDIFKVMHVEERK